MGRARSQRCAARLSWRAGCASVLSPLKKARGMERWTALARLSDAPVARLAVEPISGKFGRRSPAIRGRRAFRRSIAAIALGVPCRSGRQREAGSRRRAAHFAEVRLLLAFNLLG